MSNKFTVIDQQITTFSQVEISPDARVRSDGSKLSAIFDTNDETKTYVVGQFQYDGTEDTISLPDESIVLNVGATSITALVPKQQYVEGGN